jgi:hypothetical protein
MKRISLIHKILALVFSFTVLYTVSVREVHYLFAQHEAHEHCENHLHDATHQEHCSVCKFDIAAFTDKISVAEPSVSLSSNNKPVCFYKSPVTVSQYSFAALRGPPAIA